MHVFAKPSLTAGLVLLSSKLLTARAFSFTAGAATSCDNLTVTWTGGQEPFQLLISPAFGSQRNFSIPTGSKGTFSTQLNLPKGKTFLLTMSDATGFGSGGISELLTVGASLGGSCNTTDPGVAWTYDTPDALTQCQQYDFVNYESAIQPVTIYGMIPGGDFFVQIPPTGPPNYTWPLVDIASGTSVMFVLVDSQGRKGGVSGELQVLPSNDDSCLGTSSPSSTESIPASTAPASTSNPTSSPKSGTSDVSPAAIAATAAGAILLLAVLITLALFFLQKRRGMWKGNRLSSAIDLTYDPDADGHRSEASFPQRRYESPNAPPSAIGTVLSPFTDDVHHRSVSQYGGTEVSAYSQPQTDIGSSSLAPSQMTAAQRKAAMAAAERDRHRASYGSRVLVHTDMAEAQPNEDGVIELPPMYSAARAPLSLQTSSSELNLSHSTYPPPESTTLTYSTSAARSPIPEEPTSLLAYDHQAHDNHWS